MRSVVSERLFERITEADLRRFAMGPVIAIYPEIIIRPASVVANRAADTLPKRQPVGA